MGLHVGGIYVNADKNTSSQSVVDFIQAYWLNLGARESKKNPLEFRPLQLEKTGLLGFAIGPKEEDDQGKSWIGIYDSERYHADPDLAQALSSHFEVEVWLFTVTDSVNQAHAIKYTPQVEVIQDYEEVLKKVESFPYTLLYFNELKQFPKEQLQEFMFLAFEDVPHRPKATYSGPSQERLQTNELILQAKAYVASRNAEALLALSQYEEVYLEIIDDAIQDADPSQPEDLAFIYTLAPITIQKKTSFCSVAEAALRMKDEKMFEEVLELIPHYSLYRLEQRAFEIVNKEEYTLAFRLCEAQLIRTHYQEPRLLNNAAHFLFRVVDNPDIPSQRLEEFFKKAGEAGPLNPAIFHNLACVYVKMKNYDKALSCIAAAVKYGYPLVDQLRNDTDLNPIKSDPRFEEAFQKKQLLNSFEHLKILRVERDKKVSWIVPTVGLHLYFKKDKARMGAADLLEELSKEFPEMFAYYLKAGHIHLFPTSKGKVGRDIALLRKGGARYGYNIYYNALAEGSASDLRFYLKLDKKWDGEISIHLPLYTAHDPEKLSKRFINYAEKVPFETGNAGYSFAVYYERNGCPALEDLQHLLESYLGFTTSQGAMHLTPLTDVVIPNWLTFVGPSLAKKINLNDIPTDHVHVLHHKGIVIRAAEKPFVGLATDLSDVGLLPNILTTLKSLLPGNTLHNSSYLTLEADRLAKILQR